MPTCYIINGHPDTDSLTHANAQALKEAAEAQGITAHVLNANDFPRVATSPVNGGFPEAYNDLAPKMAEAEYIAITAPLWNLGAPGILKNFIDGVAQARVWFKYGRPNALQKMLNIPNFTGLLKTKKVVVVWTSGGPAWSYLIVGNPLVKHLKTMFKFYGAKKVVSIGLGSIHGSEEEQRAITEPFVAKLKQYKF